MMEILRLVAWLVCGIYATIPAYWMMVHPFAKSWRAARYKLTLLGPTWIVMWGIAWGVSYRWRYALLYNNPGTWVAAPLLLAISAFMYVNAGRELSFMRVIGRHELEPELQPKMLITFGVHSVVRHPMYLGHVCTMLAFTLGSGTVACYGLFAFALVAGSIMIVFEERELHSRFGSAWEEYCEHTPAIIPLPKASAG
jgi:protein-S-isoprenylcysteine O-methyltransferase Ste14